MSEHEVEQKNLQFAWSLVVLFVLLFAGTVAVAFIYLAAD